MHLPFVAVGDFAFCTNIAMSFKCLPRPRPTVYQVVVFVLSLARMVKRSIMLWAPSSRRAPRPISNAFANHLIHIALKSVNISVTTGSFRSWPGRVFDTRMNEI